MSHGTDITCFSLLTDQRMLIPYNKGWKGITIPCTKHKIVINITLFIAFDCINCLCLIFFYIRYCGRGIGPLGPTMVRKYTSARFGTHSTGEMLTEEESKLLTGMVI